jgi:hypothetical protein
MAGGFALAGSGSQPEGRGPMTLSPPQLEQRRNAAVKTGVHSERQMAPRVRHAKETFLRRNKLRARDFDAIGIERLDEWVALKAKRRQLDKAAERGDDWSRETYIALANAERLALDRLEPHVLALLSSGTTARLRRIWRGDGTEATVPEVSLLEACDEPRLLAFGAYPRQRELLRAIEENCMVVAAAGRRSGKTRAAAAGALHNLLLTPELDSLVRPGEKRYAVSVANSRAQARIFLDHALALVKASPMLRGELVQEDADSLEFRGDKILAAFPCTARGTRGWAISFLVLDEFAHFLDVDEGGPAVAGRIYAAMTPSVAQFGDAGRVVVLSTPYGDNLFAELWRKAQNGEIPRCRGLPWQDRGFESERGRCVSGGAGGGAGAGRFSTGVRGGVRIGCGRVLRGEPRS